MGQHASRKTKSNVCRKIEAAQRTPCRTGERAAGAGKELSEAEKKIGEYEKKIADLERQLALRRRNSPIPRTPIQRVLLAGAQRALAGWSKEKNQRRKPEGKKVIPVTGGPCFLWSGSTKWCLCFPSSAAIASRPYLPTRRPE